MTQSEKQIIYNWVRLGAPAGKSSSSRPAPAPKQKAPIEYDHVVKMRSTPFKVPAEGIVEYQYFVADPEFREDKWISAANVIPGNRAVVHHCIVFVRPPDDSIDDGIGWLTGYVPGQTVFELPKGQARLVPAGAKLIFQMHYTTNGRAQEDLTRVGLKFVDASTVKERVFTVVALERDFEIAPGNPNEIVPLEVNNLPREGRLLAIAPHMHVRGKAFRFFKHSKDSTEIMLDVPNYDFNWQHAYRFVKPVELKKDMRISGIAHFDNSDGNLANPDSTAIVRWGDQTFEEMVLAYFEVAVPIQVTKQDDAERARVALAKRKVSTLFKRHDKNGDNKLVLSEVPEVLLVFAFEKMDLNNDDIVTFDEALRSALQHQGRTRSRRRSPN